MSKLMLPFLLSLLVGGHAVAQTGDPIAPLLASGQGLGRPSSLLSGSGSSSRVTPTTAVMIRNRSETLGDDAVSRTRYWSVTDRDVSDLPRDAVRERLSPRPVRRDDGVRRVEVVVDLRRPVRLVSDAAVRIGTVTVDPAVRDLDVVSSLYVADVTIVARRPAAAPAPTR